MVVGFSPVVFVGKRVKVLLFLMYHVLQTLIDRRAAVSDFLQNSLEDDHIANHRVLQHVDLQYTETDGYEVCLGKLKQRFVQHHYIYIQRISLYDLVARKQILHISLKTFPTLFYFCFLF